jgi:hypothetical protein
LEKEKILFIPHANIQYSQLPPNKRKWVIENSYLKIFELLENNDYKISFEASGKTIEALAEKTPDILDRLISLIKDKKIEPIASPHTHIILSNVEPEIGYFSLVEGLNTWEKFTGVRPETGWIPECSWAYFIPEIYRKAGFKTLIADGESLLLSFPQVRKATGLFYDVKGHSNKNLLFKVEEYIKDKTEFLKFLINPSVYKNGLNLIFRSDFLANLMLWYLMGATEGVRAKKVSLEEISKKLTEWKGIIKGTGSYILPFAEDAEYVGTSAYFYVKQFGQAKFFEPQPESVDRFKNLLDISIDAGFELSLPSEVVESNDKFENNHIEKIDNGIAWHGGTSRAWMNTEYARILDPVCHSVYDGIKNINEYLGTSLETMDRNLHLAMKEVVDSYVSDSRWPPPPTSPGRFNVREAIDALFRANDAIKESMEANNIETIKSLYSPELMESQIKAVEQELMDREYFEETIKKESD